MKKALVIGGSGFAGRHVIHELLEQGFEVHALEHRKALPDKPGIHIIKGGIGAIDSKLIRTVRPDLIFHLARPTLPKLRRAGRVIAARYAEWLNHRLIKALEDSGEPLKLIFASGSLMYGSSPAPSDEDAPMNPVSYARQYYRGEIPILKAIDSCKTPVMVIRLPWLLGKGSWFEWFYLKPMRQYQAIPLFGTGDNKMEIVDIVDAARLMILASSPAIPLNTFNLLSSGAITQRKFAETLSSLSGFPVKDYRHIFPEGLEKEALEAFNSNIELTTKYPGLNAGFRYTELEESLKGFLENK